jgi:hypothetical protein
MRCCRMTRSGGRQLQQVAYVAMNYRGGASAKSGGIPRGDVIRADQSALVGVTRMVRSSRTLVGCAPQLRATDSKGWMQV